MNNHGIWLMVDGYRLSVIGYQFSGFRIHDTEYSIVDRSAAGCITRSKVIGVF
jgi:hypothetical protein